MFSFMKGANTHFSLSQSTVCSDSESLTSTSTFGGSGRISTSVSLSFVSSNAVLGLDCFLYIKILNVYTYFFIYMTNKACSQLSLVSIHPISYHAQHHTITKRHVNNKHLSSGLYRNRNAMVAPGRLTPTRLSKDSVPHLA